MEIKVGTKLKMKSLEECRQALVDNANSKNKKRSPGIAVDMPFNQIVTVEKVIMETENIFFTLETDSYVYVDWWFKPYKKINI